MFCPKCGKQIPEGGRFCGGCGTDIRAFRKETAPAPSPAAPAAAPAKAPAVRREKKKFPVKKLLLITLCLAVLAAAGFVLYQVFGMETVYLPTRQITASTNQKQTVKTEYDDRGRVLSVETVTKDRTGRGSDSTSVREYFYDDTGRLIAAEVTNGDESFDLEYNYDDKGHLKSIECGQEEADVDCDKEGRITEITWKADGESCSVEYTYHKSGGLKEIELDYGYFSANYIYDEQGNQIEYTTWYNGKKNAASQTVYEDGRIAEIVTDTYSSGKLNLTNTISYVYDEAGLPCQISFTFEFPEQDWTLTIYTEADGDGLEREFEVVDIQADGELPEDADLSDLEELRETLNGFLDGEPFITIEYDEYGNALEFMMAMGVSETSTEYIAIRVPRGFRKPNANGPDYFIPGIY